MTTDKPLRFWIRLSAADTEANPGSLADTARVTNQLERVIYGITSIEQERFTKAFSISLVEFDAW
jgi:hypothetical protein